MWNDLTRVLHTYWTQFLYVLPRLLVAAVLLAAVWVGAARLRTWLAAKIGARASDPLLVNFLTQVGRWLVVGLGLVLALNILGMSGLVSGMLAGVGLSAFVVGFAFKDIAENFLAGILLAFNRPFNINDTIQIKDIFGRVNALDLRTTTIRTFDERDVFIPNAIVLKEPLTNYTRNGLIRQDFMVGLDYESDARAAIKLMLEAVNQEAEVYHAAGKEPFAVIDELAVSTVNVKVMFWTQTDDYRRGTLELRSRIMDRVKTALQANGFGLPADIVELQFPKKPVAVTVSSADLPATTPAERVPRSPQTPAA